MGLFIQNQRFSFTRGGALAFIAALLLASSSGFAQNRTVTGTVKDETGNPLVGAAVFVEENASIGAISDANGNYSISVPESAVNLVYSLSA
uniref:carboxypeptidase regulatory-like domain-containing protein n=1 Tax=Alistipes megaguti TaxID=2364787 RepID=UPI000EFD4A39|nr:carboxypeptidase regulatory-like domain-containing protein [Alistipes megaguti]